MTEEMAPAGVAVDWSDPCQRFQALQRAYYALLAGERELEIRTRTLDAEDFVRFQAGDINRLLLEMRQAESACKLKLGLPDTNRRCAIGLGYRRRGPASDYDRRA